MTLIDGDKLVTAQLYDDEHEEFKEEQMSIIDYVNAYTTEGVTTADNVLDKIRAEIEEVELNITYKKNYKVGGTWGLRKALEIIDKYRDQEQKDADSDCFSKTRAKMNDVILVF